MDKLKFADDTVINIEDGASLSDIIHIAQTEADALLVCGKVTDENLRHVEFLNMNDTIIGSYDYLAKIENPTRQTQDDGTSVKVCIRLRQKDAMEIRLDEIEERQRQIIETQEIQDGAIEDIGMVLSDLAEG